MIALATFWLNVLLIGGVILIGAKLLFGAQGIGAQAEAGRGGAALSNTLLTMLAVALFAFAAFNIINEGSFVQAVGELAMDLITGR